MFGDNIQELVDNGYIPAFSIKDGTCSLEIGSVYKIWFRGFSSQNWRILNNENNVKFIEQGSCLTFLYTKEIEYETAGRFYFLYDSAIVYYTTTNRFLNSDPIGTYMIWFKKIV